MKKIISLIALKLGLMSSIALAHHPSGGQLPQNSFEGFLSGLGHPVIGTDHLVFILILGVLSFFISKRVLLPGLFLIGTALGCISHVFSFDIPFVEHSIAFSLVVFGAMLFSKALHKSLWVLPLALLSGVLHGYAYGESIIGTESNVLMSYLAGFTLVQFTLAFGAGLVTQKLQFLQRNSSKIGIASSVFGLSLIYLLING